MDNTFANCHAALSDDEYVKVCADAVSVYCKERKSFGPVDESACRDKADEVFKTAYRISRGYKRHDTLKPEHLLEMDATYKRLRDRIYRAVREIVLKRASKERCLAIKKTSAYALIKEAMASAGLNNCDTECQCYRAKVSVRTSKYTATLIVKYRDILDGKLDGYVKEFAASLEKLESAAYEVKICR